MISLIVALDEELVEAKKVDAEMFEMPANAQEHKARAFSPRVWTEARAFGSSFMGEKVRMVKEPYGFAFRMAGSATAKEMETQLKDDKVLGGHAELVDLDRGIYLLLVRQKGQTGALPFAAKATAVPKLRDAYKQSARKTQKGAPK